MKPSNEKLKRFREAILSHDEIPIEFRLAEPDYVDLVTTVNGYKVICPIAGCWLVCFRGLEQGIVEASTSPKEGPGTGGAYKFNWSSEEGTRWNTLPWEGIVGGPETFRLGD